MGTYIEQSDIEARFGIDNVAQWSNLDNTDSEADEDRIAAAITFAESYVQDRLRGGRYAIPFSGNTQTLTDIMARIAGVWLYQSRGDNDTAIDAKLEIHQARADALLDRIASGQLSLDLALNHSGPSAPVVV